MGKAGPLAAPSSSRSSVIAVERPRTVVSRLSPDWRNALGVAGLALLVRLAYFLIARDGSLTAPDSTDYLHLAQRLVSGGGYASAGGIFPADLNRPPGYPVFVAIASGWHHISLDQVALIQVLLGAAFAGALTFVVGRWLGSRYGLIAGCAMALDWSTVLYSPLILADLLFAMLFAIGVALVVSCIARRRTRDAILGGMVLGLAAVVKPVGIVVLLAVGIATLVRPRANWRLAACCAAMALVVLPWALRNEVRYGIFNVSTIDTVNLYFYTADGVLREPVLFTEVPALSGADLTAPQFRSIRANPAQLDSRLTSAAWTDIEQHLPKAIAQEIWGIVHVVVGTGRETLADSVGDQRIPTVIGTWIPLAQVLLMWVLAGVGMVSAWRRRLVDRSVLVLFGALIVVMVVPAGGLVGNSRFRLPITPIVCVLGAIGAAAIWDRQTGRYLGRRLVHDAYIPAPLTSGQGRRSSTTRA